MKWFWALVYETRGAVLTNSVRKTKSFSTPSLPLAVSVDVSTALWLELTNSVENRIRGFLKTSVEGNVLQKTINHSRESRVWNVSRKLMTEFSRDHRSNVTKRSENSFFYFLWTCNSQSIAKFLRNSSDLRKGGRRLRNPLNVSLIPRTSS